MPRQFQKSDSNNSMDSDDIFFRPNITTQMRSSGESAQRKREKKTDRESVVEEKSAKETGQKKVETPATEEGVKKGQGGQQK